MLFFKIIAFVLGVLAIAMGLLWVGQGTGVVMWPADSFMLADRSWAESPPQSKIFPAGDINGVTS